MKIVVHFKLIEMNFYFHTFFLETQRLKTSLKPFEAPEKV